MKDAPIEIKTILHDGTDPGITTTYYNDGTFVHSYEAPEYDDMHGKWHITENQEVFYFIIDKFNTRWEYDKNTEAIISKIIERELLGENDG